jgi:uncharacterized protein (TIGR02996 family)
MARYEKPDHESGKYWEITLKGRVVSTRSGKIGLGPASEWQGRMHFSERRGRTTEREYPDVATAKRELERRVAAKLREGFRLVDGVDPDMPAVVTDVLVNEELEAAILEAIDDPQPYLIYADWLQSRGDPRGELIAMQHGMWQQPDPGQFLAFKRQEETLRRLHLHLWLGPGVAACDYRMKLDWRYGFVTSARVDGERLPGELPVRQLVPALLASPCGRLMRALALRGGAEIATALPEVLPRSLRRVVFDCSVPTALEPVLARLTKDGIDVDAHRINSSLRL